MLHLLGHRPLEPLTHEWEHASEVTPRFFWSFEERAKKRWYCSGSVAHPHIGAFLHWSNPCIADGPATVPTL